MVSLDVTVGRTKQQGMEDDARGREKDKKRDRVDRIFRETGCHIHVLTPSWLTNGLLLSQARVTARAWPRRVVFPENRLKRIRVYNIRLECYRKFILVRTVSHFENPGGQGIACQVC